MDIEEMADKLIDIIEIKLDDVDISLDADDLDEIRYTLEDVLNKYEGE